MNQACAVIPWQGERLLRPSTASWRNRREPLSRRSITREHPIISLGTLLLKLPYDTSGTGDCRLCGKEGVRRIVPANVVDFPGACLGLGGENARPVRGRRKNLPGVGLAEKRGYDSDEEQEPQPRFFSSRIELQSGLDLAAKRRRCKARLRGR